jgi:3-hydroxybutyrate dehydrogenase
MLKDKVALITGSTSGIGLAIAKSLAASGCNIILNGFGEQKLIEEIKEDIISNFKVKCIYLGADISKAEEVVAMVKSASDELEGIDILINNAGIQYVSEIEEFPTEKWDAIIAINLSSNFHTIKAVLPYMKRKNWGRIINIASAHGLVASKNKSAYVAAKHGVVGLTKVVALEVAEMQITCNAICPGWVLTPLVEKQIQDKAKANGISYEEATKNLLQEKQPSLRFVSGEDIGNTVNFLCSAAAAGITGTHISLDGGWTAQ